MAKLSLPPPVGEVARESVTERVVEGADPYGTKAQIVARRKKIGRRRKRRETSPRPTLCRRHKSRQRRVWNPDPVGYGITAQAVYGITAQAVYSVPRPTGFRGNGGRFLNRPYGKNGVRPFRRGRRPRRPVTVRAAATPCTKPIRPCHSERSAAESNGGAAPRIAWRNLGRRCTGFWGGLLIS